MTTFGLVELIVLLAIVPLIVYFTFRKRVTSGVLILLILVLSPIIAGTIAVLTGAVLSGF